MVCLDTSFVIDLMRGEKKSRRLMDRLDQADGSIFIPSVVLMELIGSAKLGVNYTKEKGQIMDFISSFGVLNFDESSSILAGELEGDLIMTGETIGTNDVMIGAICIENGEKLITRNVKHFSRIKGLDVEGY